MTRVLSLLMIMKAMFFMNISTAAQQTFERTQQSIEDSSLLSEAYVTIGNIEERLWDHSKGPTDADKLYRSASSIKWVTSVVILRLVHEGTMSLDDTPGMYLSYWDAEDDTMTLRNFLSFTSGFEGKPLRVRCVYDGTSIDDCAESVYSEYLLDEPGTTFYYGPSHMLIAASMAQKATGLSWSDIFETKLRSVVGMNSTAYIEETANVAGGAMITGKDMEAFLQTMLRRDPNFLSPELWDEMLKDQTANVTISDSPIPEEYAFRYGLGVWRECESATFDASCQQLNVMSTTGSFGVSGWVDYENRLYGLIMTDIGPGMGVEVVTFSIEELRPKIFEDLADPRPTMAPTSSSPSPPKFCFSGENTVHVQNRGVTTMRALRVGDMVTTLNGNFERVYSFGHYSHFEVVDYIQIFTANQTDPLEITPDHLVFVQEPGISGSMTAQPASRIHVGSVLVSATNIGGIVVERIGLVSRRGFYAPFTPSGMIAVNEVVASNYVTFQKDSASLVIGGFNTTVPMHWLTHLVLSPYRMYCGGSRHRSLCGNADRSRTETSVLLRPPLLLAEWLLTS